MCTCNQQNPSSKPCKYTGIDLPTLGINTGDSVEESFQSVEDFAANLTVLAPNCNELMKYTETAAPVLNQNNTYLTLDNTIFTVPTGYTGVYEVNYVGTVDVTGPNEMSMFIEVNGSQVSFTRTMKNSADTELQFKHQINLFASNINLNEGDVLKIKAMSTDIQNCFLENCILKITRL
jgi:hypothetical protein